MEEKISIHHGSGGRYTQKLIEDLFSRYFDNDILREMEDAARFTSPGLKLAFSTDSFVITPLFFPGGDIGKLAVCGTVNDLAVSGARPLYLSAGFIIEEGFPLKLLTSITRSMAEAAREAGVKIVTGDTKVVPKGCADKIFINTSGIGAVLPGIDLSANNIKPSDSIIISGPMGEHGLAVMLAREKMDLNRGITSDCAPLNQLAEKLLTSVPGVKLLRDPTRGGAASVLNEIASHAGVGIELIEEDLPVKEDVSAICSMLGLDPLYLANEGRFIAVVPATLVDKTIQVLKSHPLGKGAAVIGKVTDSPPGKVYIKTAVGGRRIVDTAGNDQLPRIC